MPQPTVVAPCKKTWLAGAWLPIQGLWNFFCAVERELKVPGFGKMIVTASNDLNEETIDALNKQVNSLTFASSAT